MRVFKVIITIVLSVFILKTISEYRSKLALGYRGMPKLRPRSLAPISISRSRSNLPISSSYKGTLDWDPARTISRSLFVNCLAFGMSLGDGDLEGNGELPRAAKDWGVDDVSQWLWSAGAKDHIIQILFEQGIDGPQLLSLSDRKMYQIGLRRGERFFLQKQVSSLKGMKEVRGWSETEVRVWARGVGLPLPVREVLERECINGETLLHYDIEAMATDGLNCTERMLLYEQICGLRSLDPRQARDLILSLFAEQRGNEDKLGSPDVQSPPPSQLEANNYLDAWEEADPAEQESEPEPSRNRKRSGRNRTKPKKTSGGNSNQKYKGSREQLNGSPIASDSAVASAEAAGTGDKKRKQKSDQGKGGNPSTPSAQESASNIKGKGSNRKRNKAEKKSRTEAKNTSSDDVSASGKGRSRRERKAEARNNNVPVVSNVEREAVSSIVRPMITVPVSEVLTPGACRAIRLERSSDISTLRAALATPDGTMAYSVVETGIRKSESGEMIEQVSVLPSLSTVVSVLEITPISDEFPDLSPEGGRQLELGDFQGSKGLKVGGAVQILVRAEESMEASGVIERGSEGLFMIGERLADRKSRFKRAKIVDKMEAAHSLMETIRREVEKYIAEELNDIEDTIRRNDEFASVHMDHNPFEEALMWAEEQVGPGVALAGIKPGTPSIDHFSKEELVKAAGVFAYAALQSIPNASKDCILALRVARKKALETSDVGDRLDIALQYLQDAKQHLRVLLSCEKK
eukprot:CAMPEP_0167762730 /NCGR_PEP_ID=MMETSP0110_2-20121227/12946_1 /TAXON_ID=629695 /ORGANISM="Gymnochlora sp., Strain CCMP2014" /LENGTH=746 /DNA_ID=CAMNT_0007649669 /DNA_START=46 /DNA_END=2287 /DNA_ORIENTATION=+